MLNTLQTASIYHNTLTQATASQLKTFTQRESDKSVEFWLLRPERRSITRCQNRKHYLTNCSDSVSPRAKSISTQLLCFCEGNVKELGTSVTAIFLSQMSVVGGKSDPAAGSPNK